MISEETVQQVRDANDIVEVVAEFVPNLKRAGKDFKALCPFHQEKTPSFMVSPAKGIFHCFGCGTGGDVFKFVMEMEKCTYPEAIRKLAERRGIAIKQSASSKEHAKTHDEKKKLLVVLQRAAQYYHKLLMESEDASAARSYLFNKRGLKAETLKRFQLGWAPVGGRALVNTAVKAGISESDLQRAGLIVRSQRDGSWRDFFWGRILFPIFDVKGQVLAFGGRVLESALRPSDNPPPKYLNSADTEVFQKGKNLYGFYHGARAIRDKKSAVVLEGYMDVIGCHQAGYEAAVAPLGTALTSDQCHLLKRYVDQVTLLFDADRAGDSAAQRGSELLLEYGFLPLVARLPDKQDADEYLEKNSVQKFEELLTSGVSFIEFKLNILWSQNPGAPEEIKKGLIGRELMPLVARIEDPIVRKEMRKRVADRLGVGEEDLDTVLNRARSSAHLKSQAKALRPGTVEPEAAPKKNARQRIEEELVCLVIRHPEFRQDLFVADAQSALFSDPKCLECFRLLKQNPDLLQAGDLLNLLNEGTAQWLSALLFQQVESKPQEVFDSLMQRLSSLQSEEKRRNLEKPVIAGLNSGTVRPEVLEYKQLAQASKGTPK